MKRTARIGALITVALAGLAGLALAQAKLAAINSQEVLEKSAEGKRAIAALQAADKKYSDDMPVYAVASPVYVTSTVGRLCLAANREGLVKQGLPETRRGLHETIQSALGKPRATTETVQMQLYNTADFEGVTGV